MANFVKVYEIRFTGPDHDPEVIKLERRLNVDHIVYMKVAEGDVAVVMSNGEELLLDRDQALLALGMA